MEINMDVKPIISYYPNGNKKREYWFINNEELTGKKLEVYKEWVTARNLYNKSYTQWEDAEKILWNLTWL